MNAKRRANIVAFVVMTPYLWLRIGYPDLMSMHAWLYVALFSFLGTVLVYQWVYHREVASLAAAPAPAPELNLALERLPPGVWLAALPPMLVIAVVGWVTAHGADLPWRHPGSGSFGSSSSYRFFLAILIILNGFSGWHVVRRLAEWHGMSRAYASRGALLQKTIAMQWAGFGLSMGSAVVTGLSLPSAIEIAVVIPELACGVYLAWTAGQIQRLTRANPRTGSWFYFEFRDPAFLGSRGLNVANAWCWLLAVTFFAPIALVEWMLHRLQG